MRACVDRYKYCVPEQFANSHSIVSCFIQGIHFNVSYNPMSKVQTLFNCSISGCHAPRALSYATHARTDRRPQKASPPKTLLLPDDGEKVEKRFNLERVYTLMLETPSTLKKWKCDGLLFDDAGSICDTKATVIFRITCVYSHVYIVI